MAWVKIEDGIFRNPKVVAVGSASKLLYVASICYSGSSLTDGFIPRNAVAILGAEIGITAAAKAARELVAVGLWREVEAGYQVHDYLAYNESAEKVHAKRDAARDRAARNRSGNSSRSSREVREKFAKTSGEVREPEAETDTEGVSNETQGADAPADHRANVTELPTNGAAQQIVKAFCEATGIDKPVAYGKTVGQAQQLADAGISPNDIPDAVKWCEGQKWLGGSFDLGTILSQADKWRAYRRQQQRPQVRRHVV